jgi:hypothetical protein
MNNPFGSARALKCATRGWMAGDFLKAQPRFVNHTSKTPLQSIDAMMIEVSRIVADIIYL